MWQTSQQRNTDGRVALPHNGYREGVKALVVVGAIIVLDRQPWRVPRSSRRSGSTAGPAAAPWCPAPTPTHWPPAS